MNFSKEALLLSAQQIVDLQQVAEVVNLDPRSPQVLTLLYSMTTLNETSVLKNMFGAENSGCCGGGGCSEPTGQTGTMNIQED